MRIGKRGNVKQLANKSINYSAFLTATLIPTIWLLFANLALFILRNERLLQPHRLTALRSGVCVGHHRRLDWTNRPAGLIFLQAWRQK